MFADFMEWLQSMATVTPDQQLSFQNALMLDGTVRGSQLETPVAGRIPPAFGKELNSLRPSSEIDVDLAVLAVVLPLHARAS